MMTPLGKDIIDINMVLLSFSVAVCLGEWQSEVLPLLAAR